MKVAGLLTLLGLACIATGAFLLHVAAGFLVTGVAIIAVARTTVEGS